MQGRRVRSQVVMMMVVMVSGQIVSRVVVQVAQGYSPASARHQTRDGRGDTDRSRHRVMQRGMVVVQVLVLISVCVVGVHSGRAPVLLALAVDQVLQAETRRIGHVVHDDSSWKQRRRQLIKSFAGKNLRKALEANRRGCCATGAGHWRKFTLIHKLRGTGEKGKG